jgi:hypothetical protein
MARPGGASEGREPAGWSAVLRGDRDAFQAAVAPHVPELLKAAQRELRYGADLSAALIARAAYEPRAPERR